VTVRGSCLCGEIAYEITQLDSPIEHCSCRYCRKAHAAAYNTAACVRREHFRWLKGVDRLTAYESSPGKRRYFCSRCGTQLIAEREGLDAIVLRVATLDEDPGRVPEFRIWASDEVPWLAYGPDIVAYPGWEPGHE
jgi:ADP-ribosyl-[dinitrogen reductase] hydrolase